ncbi:CXXX repeat peptide modification system protein [Myxococcota bacterium]|nr:CXXX repeat peptide modification system protein [Myxococcota bacterium]
MTRDIVATVTHEEKETIRRLFTRRTGLIELVKSLKIKDFEDEGGTALYEKIVADMGTTTIAFDAWWDTMQRKYAWPNGVYSIDFETAEIYQSRP